MLLVAFRGALLPARYSYDGIHISEIARGVGDTYGDKSYETVSAAYKVLGLGAHTTTASVLGLASYLAVLGLVRWRLGRPRITWGVLGVVFAMILLGAVYLGFYSKDVFVLIVVATLLLAPSGRFGELAISSSLLLYGLCFRSYWLLVLLLYRAYRLVVMPHVLPRYGMRRFLLLGLLMCAAAAAAIYLWTGVSADVTRDSVNSARFESPDAQTMIRSFVSFGDPASSVVNTVLTAISLVLPFPLLLKGGIFYIILGALISIMWVLFFSRLHTERVAEPSLLHFRSASLVLAFVSVQSLFEPDYGSALKHLTPLLPLILLVIASDAAQQKPASDRAKTGVSASPAGSGGKPPRDGSISRPRVRPFGSRQPAPRPRGLQPFGGSRRRGREVAPRSVAVALDGRCEPGATTGLSTSRRRGGAP